VKTVVGVIAHHKRAEQAWQLAETVGASYVSVDDGSLGAEANHRRVWDRLANNHAGAEFCVALEDDAQPVDNFGDQLDKALAAAPCDVVSLYLGSGHPIHWQPRIQTALTADAHWLTCDHLFHAVAVAIRTELLPLRLDSRRPIDEAISRWCRTHRHSIAYTVPSLVDHADGPPLITHRADGTTRHRPRRAWRLGTRDLWTGEAAHLA
jgi:hypothetical protein